MLIMHVSMVLNPNTTPNPIPKPNPLKPNP